MVVLYQEEMGVYLGSFLGLGFWSKMGAVGQRSAPAFENSAVVADVVKKWDTIPEGIRAVVVDSTDVEGYATMATCMRAGLPGWGLD